jgi:hypothetical protein
MLGALLIFLVSLAAVLGAAWFLRGRSRPELPEELLRPPPPQGFENLSAQEYELIEWELHVEPPREGPRDDVAPPKE